MQFSHDPFAVDHIQPTSREGSDSLDNLAYSCLGCNGYKLDRVTAVDPITLETVPLFHPRRHSWREHFTWNADFTVIVGTTPIGRATVEVLRLNREGLMNQRRVLRLVGEHPEEG
jgi:hypothetical protein